MSPQIEEEILKTLKAINHKLEEDLSDYCNSQQAQVILGIGLHEQLKWLVDNHYITKYPRGSGFRFKRSVLRKVAEMIDRSEIVLPAFKKKDRCGITKESQQ